MEEEALRFADMIEAHYRFDRRRYEHGIRHS